MRQIAPTNAGKAEQGELGALLFNTTFPLWREDDLCMLARQTTCVCWRDSEVLVPQGAPLN